MGYSFADLGAEGCCRSLIALLPLQLVALAVFKSPQSGATLCFQFASAASTAASAAATTFASPVKTL